MKTSYYLVAAAGLTAAVVTVYDRLPLRAQAPAALLPMPHDPVALAPATLPALPPIPDVPLPPIVPPPDGPLLISAADEPALPPTPSIPPLPVPPAAVATPVIPRAATTPTVPAPVTPTVPLATTTASPPRKPVEIPEFPTIPSVPPVPLVPSVPLASPTPSGPQVAPAPAPIVPAAPQEPKPFPLPAPTPFTPGLDSLNPDPAAKLAAAGKFVVVKGNKLIEGAVKTDGDKVTVRQGSLDRTFAKIDVLYVAESRDEVCRFMLAKVPADNADSRLLVAKWCTLNGLREQALVEALAILKLKPGHRGATDIARSMEESLRQFPVAGTDPPKPHGALVTVVEPEPDVSPEGATSFVTRAQPILANQCMECHARADHAGAFKLIRVTGFEVGPQATYANLRAVAGQLKKDDPANSPLLAKALTAHGGMKQPPFVSRQAVAFRTLEAWVCVAVANSSVPNMTPPSQPLIPPTAPVSPIPPATTLAQPEARSVLPPVEVVPSVLPTPSSLPAAESGMRTTPAKLPLIPMLPKPPDGAKPAGQFGTGTKSPVPPGVDEFDPAGFNRSVPSAK